MIAVEVSGISISPPYQGYVVILKEKEGDQWLPIFIGATEAHTISLLLQGLKYVRPLTYDMFHSLLKATTSTVEKIEVTSLKENTFYALIHLNTPDGVKEIDARPSDAIALALKTESPIFVAPEVFTEAGMRGEVAQSEPISVENKLEELNQQLKEAVDTEAYEEAARIRDKIRDIETNESEPDMPLGSQLFGIVNNDLSDSDSDEPVEFDPDDDDDDDD